MAREVVTNQGHINRLPAYLPLPGGRRLVLPYISPELRNSLHKEGQVLTAFDQLVRGHNIPQEQVQASRQRIRKAFEESRMSPQELRARYPGVTSAFLVHTRTMESPDGYLPELDDTRRVLPALDRAYGLDPQKIRTIWEHMPSFVAGQMLGTITDQQGQAKPVNCAIISVQITPDGLMDAKKDGGFSGPSKYAQGAIHQAARLGTNLGAEITGLGEVLATLTNHGRSLQAESPDMKFTTGHAFTTLLIWKWTEKAAELKGKDLSELTLMINGANGSIGKSTLGVLGEKAGRLLLHEQDESRAHALRNAIDKGKLPDSQGLKEKMERGEIEFSWGEEMLAVSCKKADIITSSVTAYNHIRAEHLKPGTFIVDDSQPPSVLREEAEKAGAYVFWVVGHLPGIVRTFDYGLREGGEWGCAMEAMIGQATGFNHVGPVTKETVLQAEQLAHHYFAGVAEPQSFGRPVFDPPPPRKLVA